MPYTRAQLKLILIVALLCLVGLAVREWRNGFPEVADRLERFDHEPPPSSAPLIVRAAPIRSQPPPAAASSSRLPLAATAATPTIGWPAQAPPPAGPLDLNRASV